VPPAIDRRPALETSFEISGTILGIDATTMGIYRSTLVKADRRLTVGGAPPCRSPHGP
jgi:hypothetical protein